MFPYIEFTVEANVDDFARWLEGILLPYRGRYAISQTIGVGERLFDVELPDVEEVIRRPPSLLQRVLMELGLRQLPEPIYHPAYHVTYFGLTRLSGDRTRVRSRVDLEWQGVFVNVLMEIGACYGTKPGMVELFRQMGEVYPEITPTLIARLEKRITGNHLFNGLEPGQEHVAGGNVASNDPGQEGVAGDGGNVASNEPGQEGVAGAGGNVKKAKAPTRPADLHKWKLVWAEIELTVTGSAYDIEALSEKLSNDEKTKDLPVSVSSLRRIIDAGNTGELN